MSHLRLLLVIAASVLTGYCAGTAPALADAQTELCPQLAPTPQRLRPPNIEDAHDKWVPDSRDIS